MFVTYAHAVNFSFLLQINIENDFIKSHKLTTEEILECCKDVKVLGKTEIRSCNTFNWTFTNFCVVFELASATMCTLDYFDGYDVQYSSFIVHQNCVCFNVILMHNK